MPSYPSSEGKDAVLLSFPYRAQAAAAAALAALWLTAAASPVHADQIRTQEWWLPALHVTKAWPTSEGAGVTVALLDTGVDTAAPDVQGVVTTGPDFTGSGRRSGGRYWGAHGTAIASLIAGHGHGPRGGEGITGVAPRANILSIRVVMEKGDPMLAHRAITAREPGAIAAGIRYAADHGAQVVDLPLDPRGTGAAVASPVEQAAVTYALAKKVTLVAPAGDDGAAGNHVSYPAAYPGVIAVGAFDRNIVKAPFTNRRAYVTLTSAGAGVVAATPSGGYAMFNSTSAASAMVAGMAALIKSRYPAFTPAQVTQALTHSTVFHPAAGRAHGSGFGTADAARALALAAVMQSSGAGQVPGQGHTAAAAAPPAIAAAGHSFGTSLLNDAILLFLLLLAVLLVMSLVAVIRAPAPPAKLAGEDEEEEEAATMPQHVMPAHPGTLPVRQPSQRSYADAASRLSPPRPGVPAHVTGTGRAGPGYPPRPATGPVPWQGTIRPPNVPGGPPWGPAPKPESEPPPPGGSRRFS